MDLKLEDLPNEILEKIIFDLDKKTIAKVNKRFNDLSKNKKCKYITVNLAKEINLDDLKHLKHENLKIIYEEPITANEIEPIKNSKNNIIKRIKQLRGFKNLKTIYIELNITYRMYSKYSQCKDLNEFITLRVFNELKNTKVINFYVHINNLEFSSHKNFAKFLINNFEENQFSNLQRFIVISGCFLFLYDSNLQLINCNSEFYYLNEVRNVKIKNLKLDVWSLCEIDYEVILVKSFPNLNKITLDDYYEGAQYIYNVNTVNNHIYTVDFNVYNYINTVDFLNKVEIDEQQQENDPKDVIKIYYNKENLNDLFFNE